MGKEWTGIPSGEFTEEPTLANKIYWKQAFNQFASTTVAYHQTDADFLDAGFH